MARFRGVLSDGRGDVTKLGHATTGLRGQVDGWGVGVAVDALVNTGEQDVFVVSMTRGSGSGHAHRLGTVTLVAGVMTFTPEPVNGVQGPTVRIIA